MLDFDKIWQKYSKQSRIEFVCFSFHVGLLSQHLFVFHTGHRQKCEFGRLNSHKCANFDEVPFFKTFIQAHNIRHTLSADIYKHNTLINELLLMQFCLFNIRPKCITGSGENFASHCSELTQLHPQPVVFVLRSSFVRKFCYKLWGAVAFTFMHIFVKSLSSSLNGAMLTGNITCNLTKFPLSSVSGLKIDKVHKKRTYTKTEEYKPYTGVF